MILKLLIEKKRDRGELSADEIRALVSAYVAGEFSDAQMSAFAMAVCCRGMTPAETAVLTDAMRTSGDCFNWSGLPRPVADKHSTGGVGDKLSFIIQPIAAAAGMSVPSLSGRGLGLTGGTIDKLESIPGFRAEVPAGELRRRMQEPPYLCICSQTPEICPADRKLYALRDVTGTVASIPLITASILSKKLAEGAGVLVFDVKCGRGAFMRTRADADALAASLVDGARRLGRKAAATVTPMDVPLGRAVGNSLEIEEALEVLSGRGPQDVRGLSLHFAAQMVELSGLAPSPEAARAKCEELLDGGEALRAFRAAVAAQGGDWDAFEREKRAGVRTLEVAWDGPEARIADVDAEKIARAALMLGAGRSAPGEKLDLKAGIVLRKKPGETVRPGETAAELHATRADRLTPEAAALVRSAFSA